jgi:hypothetical protein
VGGGICGLVKPPTPPSGIKFVTPHQGHSGAEAPAAGVNPKKCGSTGQQRNLIGSWRYPHARSPEWQPRSDTLPKSHNPIREQVARPGAEADP